MLKAWASHKSIKARDGGEGEARLYRKGKTDSELRYMGRTLAISPAHGVCAQTRIGERGYGWAKIISLVRQVMARGLKRDSC